MIRCYITDRRSCAGDLLENIERCARQGLNYIQIREKDLSGRELFELVTAALGRVARTSTKIVVNDRADVALAAGAHGVHLRSDAVPVREWKRVLPAGFLIGVSCHTLEDVSHASGADFLVYGPVFPSPGKGPAVGLTALAEAARRALVPVLALGGITAGNTQSCLDAGAAGIAAIRLFQLQAPETDGNETGFVLPRPIPPLC